METFDWGLFLGIAVLSLIGAVLVIPYAFAINDEKLKDAPVSRRTLVIASVIQGTMFTLVPGFIGLLAIDALGLKIFSSPDVLPLAVLLGIVAGGGIITLEKLVFKPFVPAEIHQTEKHTALWKRFAASFYGGFNEEVSTRLGLMTIFTWLVSRVWQTPAGDPAVGAYWAGILGAALLFGALHLPAVAAMTRVTPMLVLRTLALNGFGALIFGWLYWQHGLVAAIIAHFSTDIVLHIIWPFFTKPGAPQPDIQTPVTSAQS